MAFMNTPFVPVPMKEGTTPDEIALAKSNGVIPAWMSVYADAKDWFSKYGWAPPETGVDGKYWADPYITDAPREEYSEWDGPGLQNYVIFDPSNPIDTTKFGWQSHPSWNIYSFGFFNFIYNYKSRFPKVPGLKVLSITTEEAHRWNLKKPNAHQTPFCRGTQFQSHLGLRFNPDNGKLEAFEWQEFANKNKSDGQLGK